MYSISLIYNGFTVRLSQMEEISFTPSSSTIAGIQIEKLCHQHKTVEYLYQRNNFTPILPNNQIYSQGFFNEIHAFVNAVENKKDCNVSAPETIKEVYRLVDGLRKN